MFISVSSRQMGFPGGSVGKNPPGSRGSLIWEDPTGCCATEPVCPNWWVCALEPKELQLLSPHPSSTEAWAHYSPSSATWEATAMRSSHTTLWSSPSSPQLDRSPRSNGDPAQPGRNKWTFKKLSRQIEIVKLSFKVAVPFFILISNEQSSYWSTCMPAIYISRVLFIYFLYQCNSF